MSIIYKLNFENGIYVGVTSDIKKRINIHLHYLRNNSHNNQRMQEAFNKGEYINYEEIRKVEDSLKWEEEEKEIRELSQVENLYNITKGKGLTGFSHKKESKEKISNGVSGERNGSSKITDEQFFDIVDMLREGKTNDEIALVFNIHSRYVSLIRHKRRHKKLWSKVDYNPQKSDSRDLSYNDYCEIMRMNKIDKISKKEISQIYGMDPSTVSRICNGKTYKDFYKMYISQ